MADLDRRLRRLERPAGRNAGYAVLFCEAGETAADAWSRQHPGKPLPLVPVVTVGWLPAGDLAPEAWAAWARGGDDGRA